ncbi:MAG TPA: 6,7-dimethyl-8-ribityllumazine synthase [Bacteroidia bacterium]|nr:6,7-dimethyl-8-ribityllumazine synthase [Bacteroidia bacterium]
MLTSENIDLLYPLKNKENIRIGIVYTQWNARLTDMMYFDAVNTLKQAGILEKNIESWRVPGAVEIPFAAKKLAEKKSPSFDGVLNIGCIIKGDTPHFDYVSMSVTQGITQLNLMYPIPFIFGILTTNNFQQALERSSVKGREFAITLLNMIALSQQI